MPQRQWQQQVRIIAKDNRIARNTELLADRSDRATIAVIAKCFDFVNHDPILQIYFPTAK
jgi:hypothetical protein